MGRTPMPISDDREKQLKRNANQRYYHNSNGKLNHKIRYLMRRNNISYEDVEGMDIEEKLKYCRHIHAINKYNLDVNIMGLGDED